MAGRGAPLAAGADPRIALNPCAPCDAVNQRRARPPAGTGTVRPLRPPRTVPRPGGRGGRGTWPRRYREQRGYRPPAEPRRGRLDEHAAPGSHATNSSPPNRATTSPCRTSRVIACDVWHSTASPTEWPWLSFIRLKWSRSMKRIAPAARSGTRSVKPRRLASPVSGSVLARCLRYSTLVAIALVHRISRPISSLKWPGSGVISSPRSSAMIALCIRRVGASNAQSPASVPAHPTSVAPSRRASVSRCALHPPVCASA